MKDNKKINLLSLSPKDDLFEKDDGKYQYYKNIFDNTFRGDEKNQNVAISGKYGSGKSSLIYSYIKDNSTIIKENQSLKINFSNLGPNFSKEKNDIGIDKDENRFINEIALSIINQIIYQIDHSKIPLTHFKIKEERDWKTSIAILIMLFAIIWVPLINIIFPFFPDNINRLRGVIILLFCITASLFIMKPLFNFIQNFDIKRVKLGFKNLEAEINYENDDFFEEYIDEIIYLFTSFENDTDKSYLLIIEDLDRFDNIEIFRKLKDLNIKLNQKSESNWTFLYLIKDQLFHNDKERTKFFDLIIPVIPFITSHNSYYKLKDMFKGQLDENLIFFTSRFIDDYRLLSNVYNEYIIFKNLINESVNEWELFSLIVYKNIFPDKFDDLQNGSGILKEILSSYIDDINKQISDIKLSIVNFERKSFNKYLENNYVTIPEKNVYGNLKDISPSKFDEIIRNDYSLRDIKRNDLTYSKLKENSMYHEKYLSDGYDSLIERLNLLESHDLSCISENVISDFHKKTDENYDKYTKEFAFVYGLIKNKYLTINYLNTINYLYGNPNDFKFIDNIIKRDNEYDINLNITGLDNIIRKLNNFRYAWDCPQILNVNLLKYILDVGGNDDLFNQMMKVSQDNFLESFINKYNDYVSIIYKRYPELSLDINTIKMNHKTFLFIIQNNIYVHNDKNEKLISEMSTDLNDTENVQIINNEFIDGKTKKQVMKSLSSIDFVEIKDKSLWNALISSKKVNHTFENAIAYYENIEERCGEFYDFLDETPIPYDENLNNDYLNFLNDLIKDNDLHIAKFSEITLNLSEITVTNSDISLLSDSKIEIIIDRFNVDLDDDLFNRIVNSSIRINDDVYIKLIKKYNFCSDDKNEIVVANYNLLRKSLEKNDLESFKFTINTLIYRDIEQNELLVYLNRIKDKIDLYKDDLKKIIKIIEGKTNSTNAKVLNDDLRIMIHLVHYMKEKKIIEKFKLTENSEQIMFH